MIKDERSLLEIKGNDAEKIPEISASLSVEWPRVTVPTGSMNPSDR